MSEASSGAVVITYRCQGCGHAFTDTLAGVVDCPRCQSIADHEQVGNGFE